MRSEIGDRNAVGLLTLHVAAEGGLDRVERDPRFDPVDPALIAEIRYWHRRQRFWLSLRNRQILALGAFMRVQLGWRPDHPDRAAIADRVQDLIAAVQKGKESDDPLYDEYLPIILTTLECGSPAEEQYKYAIKELESRTRRLPVWEWAKDVKGLGAKSLGEIIGEAGDLSNYATIPRLWKRLGLAVLDGHRQGNPGKGATAEDWIEEGYRPSRRAVMWVVGGNLMKKRTYREEYLARRAHTETTHPEWTDKHRHDDANRYIQKRLLKHLWQAWRGSIIK